MTTIAVIGAGSVGRALGSGASGAGYDVVYGVRDPTDERHAGRRVATLAEAAAQAAAVILAVPAAAVPETVPSLALREGQAVIDATNAVRMPVPGGHPTMADLVTSLVPHGVAVAKAFNTIGAEHLTDGRLDGRSLFLPIAGDPGALDVARPLAEALGFDVAVVGDRSAFDLVEAHARLWIQLAFGGGWGRGFGFSVVGR